MLRLVKNFERVVVYALLVMLMAVVLFATIELGVMLVVQGSGNEPPSLLLDFKDLLDIFGFFLLVLIGLELAETVYAYLEEEKIHVEVVFLVGMVAVARKVITLDYTKVEPPILYGVAAIALALTVGYYLLKRTIRDDALLAGEKGAAKETGDASLK